MTLECGSIHFCSLRSNKNTKAFCVVQHGIRSASQHTPGPSAASEAEIKVRRVSCRTSSVFLLIVYNLLAAVPVLGSRYHKKPLTNLKRLLCSQESRRNVRRGLFY